MALSVLLVHASEMGMSSLAQDASLLYASQDQLMLCDHSLEVWGNSLKQCQELVYIVVLAHTVITSSS